MSSVNAGRFLRSGLLGLVAALALPAAARAGDTFVYIHDRSNATTEVWAFRMEIDGSLTPVVGSPFNGPGLAGGCGGYCMTAAEGKLGKNHFLFTASPQGVTSWTISVNGTLAPVTGSPFDGGAGVENFLGTATVAKGGHLFVYSNIYGMSKVAGLAVEPDGGLHSVPGSPFITAVAPDGLDAAGDTVLCAGELGQVASFRIQANGSLVAAPGSPLTTLGPVYNAQLDDKGRRAYFAVGTALFAYAVDKKTSALSPLASSPFDLPLGDGLGGGEVLQPKLVLHVALMADPGVPDVAIFTRAPDGALTLLGRQVTGLGAITAHAVDKKCRRFVVASNAASLPNVASYRLDPKTGAMILADQEQIPVTGVNDVVIVEL